MGYQTRLAGHGAGPGAVRDRHPGRGGHREGGPVLSFGFASWTRFQWRSEIKLKNFGNKRRPIDVTTTGGQERALVRSGPRGDGGRNGDAEVEVQLSVPAATAGDSSAFSERRRAA